MKKTLIIFLLLATCISYLAFVADFEKPVHIEPSVQRTGDAGKGYEYVVTGDYLKSGIPYNLFLKGFGSSNDNHLKRTGDNEKISYEYTAVNAPNGELVVAPNCMQCHAQVFDGKLVMGLGNTSIDFSQNKSVGRMAGNLYTMLSLLNPKQLQASKSFLQATRTIAPDMTTEVRGVNAAGRLAALLVAHRDPQTLQWSSKPIMDIPKEVVPTDFPAWWLLKKKNAMFYNGYGRGDFSRFLMASNLLTVSDSSEAREVYGHFNDVLAYVYSLEAPKYDRPIDKELAESGQALFNDNCSKCHGTYGEKGEYPNLLIPSNIIRTDSALFKSNSSFPQFIDWFNKSWFTTGDNPARLVPFDGYIAPPLDGIWITAPYLHNGSVPTLEGVLNSKARPAYWTRDFDKPEYDYASPGWKYTAFDKPERKAYNTTLPGYGNYGHYFGDKLTATQRKAVIEYLKTL
ncbi:c-type cytochrome [Segetibacter sp. 3557_3]|uniref:c-type cytochrome n=1 Tax=Segetibacter sp. 3557_3 TaxID=2547429 RepID=UPI001058CC84|nr:c-type cytochrome [Segetibacter sp. 3557_3]TDH25563.1 c-type cytochrome [Segetibacter sp. 3557_3]